MSNRTESASQTNRRGFIKSASAAALITITPTAISNCYADQVGVSGDFDFSWKNGKLHVKAKDVLINGLTIPKFTWGWIGLGIAEGVLSALGGAIFGALANAIFGSGKSMEQLLKEQLAEIARIVEEKLQENDLRNYQAKVGGFVTLFREYNNNPTMSRLNYLTNESAPLLSEIESLGFKGYRTYMTTAGLRLSVLQQQIKKSNTAGNRANFADQRDVSMEFHNEMQALIDERSDVNYYVKQLLDWLKGQDFPFKEDFEEKFRKGDFPISFPILGIKPAEMPLKSSPTPLINLGAFGPPYPAAFIDWPKLRTMIDAKNTDLGALMIDKWKRTKV